jgi:hypothetical protein
MLQDRAIIAGAFADFLVFLTSLDDPIVVGGNYPRTKILSAFTKWSKSRDFNTEDANVAKWRELCNEGLMKKVLK